MYTFEALRSVSKSLPKNIVATLSPPLLYFSLINVLIVRRHFVLSFFVWKSQNASYTNKSSCACCIKNVHAVENHANVFAHHWHETHAYTSQHLIFSLNIWCELISNWYLNQFWTGHCLWSFSLFYTHIIFVLPPNILLFVWNK